MVSAPLISRRRIRTGVKLVAVSCMLDRKVVGVGVGVIGVE